MAPLNWNPSPWIVVELLIRRSLGGRERQEILVYWRKVWPQFRLCLPKASPIAVDDPDGVLFEAARATALDQSAV